MTKEEKEVLYQCYLESGLTISEFAKLNNVKPAIIRGLVSFHNRTEAHEHSGFIDVFAKGENTNNEIIYFKFDNHLIEINPSFLKLFLGAISND